MSRRRRAFLALIVVASFGFAAMLSGADAAAASTTAPTSEVTPVTPTPTATPSPSPSPSKNSDRSHEQQNGEQGVQRDDLGFAGVLVVFGFAFMLTMMAASALVTGHARRRRDRATASVSADKEHSDG